MPDPSELIFPDEPDFLPNEPLFSPPPRPEPQPPRPTPPRPPMRPPTPPLCSVAGSVKNRFGFPISNVRVALYTSASGSFRPIDEVRTDRFGRFFFSRVRPGQYTLVATGRYRSARRLIRVNARNCALRNINIQL